VASIRALQEEVRAVGGEMLLFDNHSHDSTVKAVSSEFPEVEIIHSSRNIGFAAANNKASQSARGQYLLFANPDMIMDRGALAELLKVFQKYPSAGAAVGRMRHPDGRFQPTCRQLPKTGNIIFSRGSVMRNIRNPKGAADRYTLGDSDEVLAVPAASATCMLIKRDFFASLGGFDERFFLFMEDTDLCLRIHQAGKEIYFAPQAGAVHFWGKGSSLSPIRRSWHHHLSIWKYFLKYCPNGFSLFFLPVALLANFLLSTLISRGEK
jgi:GT2 family glycosyltransferase